MKTIFQALARYNRNVNLEIIGILEGMPAEKLAEKTKAYFPTINDAAGHILLSDMGILKRFKPSFADSKALNSSPLMAADTAVIKKEIEADIKKYFQYRKEIDAMIMEFTEELTDEKLNNVMKFTNHKGEAVESVAWKYLITVFNHQTHHRGGISVMLDMAGVKNDFSGTLSRI
jgi:uncharacterized damage-inducible protein DinB